MRLDCQHKKCIRFIEIKSKWDAIRAWSEGWYQSKDGTKVFCPGHLPEWVKEYRACKEKPF